MACDCTCQHDLPPINVVQDRSRLAHGCRPACRSNYSLLTYVNVRSGVAVNENNAVGLDGGAAFERWIKTGSWAEDGTDPQLRAMAIATAVVRA